MDGIVVIDKPAGCTSHDVVSRVKKILGARKAGHTGTLDPMATGVLPVCVGEATKLAQFLSLENKTYRATMLLGVRTETQDIEGAVTQKSDAVVSEEAIRQALGRMVGKIRQTPPAYSALKHKGKPLYQYARRGEFPEIAPRDVEIYKLDVLEVSFPCVTFEMSCSKGTYVRTVCADVGEALGTGACLSGLRRLKSGFFSEAMAVSLEDPAARMPETLRERMIPLAQCLPSMVAMMIGEESVAKLKTGFQPDTQMLESNVPAFLAAGDMIKLVDTRGQLVAVAQMILAAGELARQDAKNQVARILRVFN